MENQEQEITNLPTPDSDSSEHSNPESKLETTDEESNVGDRRPNAFEARRQSRIDRLRDRADRKNREGEQYLKRADSVASCIPPGQPILVGHHSEKRHRRDLDRIHNSTRKGLDSLDAAKELRLRAIAAESNSAIFTEDPAAVDKLETRIKELEKEQALMKEINKRIRLGKSLSDLGYSESVEAELHKPDFMGRVGFPDYKLKNNSSNLRRLKGRLELLRKQQSQPVPEDIEKNGIRLVENLDLNRVQLFFPGKPSESVRDKLKRNGFRWAHFSGCWQRHRSAYASQLAREFLTPSISTAAEETSK